MCTAHDHSAQTTAPVDTGISFRVEDMTCGHCAGVIKGAIEKTIAGTAVHADPASRTVSVTGASDAESIAGIITAAGYTPQANV